METIAFTFVLFIFFIFLSPFLIHHVRKRGPAILDANEIKNSLKNTNLREFKKAR
jgi:hypothetical protein